MRTSRLFTIAGVASLLMGSSSAVLGMTATEALADSSPCGSTGVAGISSCSYPTVGADTFTVPAGITSVTFVVAGAEGGESTGRAPSGLGGRVGAKLAVTSGEVLQVNIGGQGQAGTADGAINNGAGGGGSSDVRTGSFGLGDRVLVAGGGGGSGGSGGSDSGIDPTDVGGAGGAGGGGNGQGGNNGGAAGGTGGTATTGGSGGLGVNGGGDGAAGSDFFGGAGGTTFVESSPGGGSGGGAQAGVGEPGIGCTGGGGGGGGGYFGGGGGGSTACRGGGGAGGGGSNFIAPSATSASSSSGVQSGNGMVSVAWRSPTTLTATPAVIKISGLKLYLFNLSATLTDAAGPVAGQAITFTAGSTALCTAVTNASGTASCNATVSLLSIVLSLGYTATFAGNSSFGPSTATASLIS